MAHAVEHIKKLKATDARQIIYRGMQEKMVLACTVGSELKVFDLTLQGELLADHIHLASKKWESLIGQECAFSFKVDTRVYFFKTKVKKQAGDVVIKTDFDLFELVRRKDVRHKIPYEWPQSAAVLIDSKKEKKIAANIMDLSRSGIRLQLLAQLPEFKVGRSITFTIKIHRRAVAQINGVVKHSKRLPNQLPVIGVEFVDLTRVLEDRILNICNDIVRFQLLSQQNKKSL